MRSFSEEKSNGTIELLITKPLSSFEIFGGKFIGITLIIIIILLSSSINILAVFALIEDQSKFDWGSLFSSYLALLLMCLSFLSMSICSSIIFRNQVSSFLMASLLCFGQFFLWDLFAYLLSDPVLYQFISDQPFYSNILATDISHDGAMQGPSFSVYKDLLHLFPSINLIASGGIRSLDDLNKLKSMNIKDSAPDENT